MTNNSRTFKCSRKSCSYITTGRVFQITLRGREISPVGRGGGRMGNFAWGNFFSLVSNSSLRLKMNISILKLSILLSKDLLFLYYIEVIWFWFFYWEKSIFLIYFIALFYPGYVPDFMMYHIWYTIHFFFFSKIEKATFTNQFNVLIFEFRLKTKLFSRFY